MAGVEALQKLQIGLESVAGTAVPATVVWRGKGGLDDRREVVFPEENIGLMADQDRSYTPSLLSAVIMDEVPATYEQLAYLFACGIKNTTSGATDGSGTGKIYAYPFSMTATPNTIKTATIEGGDNQEVEEVEYAFATKIKLSGKAKEAVKMSAEWLGRQSTVSSFTALSVAAVEDILFGGGKLWIDAIGGTIGTTQKSATLLGMELSIDTGIQPVWTGDGATYFTFHKLVKPKVELKITFEHDGSATAEKAFWRSQTARLIRLQFNGTAWAIAGTAYTNKALRLDMAGKWSKFDKIDVQDGNDVVTATFLPRLNATAAKFFEAQLSILAATL